LAIAFFPRTAAFNDGLNFGVIGIKTEKTGIDFQNIVSGKLEIIFGKTIEASVLCPTQEH
jgi:hypothetical protein